MSGVVRTRSGDIPPRSRQRGRPSVGAVQTKIVGLVVGVLTVYVIGTTIYQAHFAGMFVPDIEVDETGRARVRRRPHRHKQKLDPNKPTTEYDAVLEGYLTLVDINILPNSLQGVEMYKGITAKFCHIDWKLQEKEPHKVPMFNDLVRKSALCDSTMVTLDLWDLVKQARAYDTMQSKDVLPVPPTGVIFHESRCGSTLIANMLGGFSPKHTRVYSENQVHVQAMTACGRNPCNPDLHEQMLRDVFYLSGRTVRKERPQYVFYKISSIGTMSLDSFTTALPSVPWTYLYRDTVEIMQSHFKKGSVLSIGRSSPVCLRMQQSPNQPALTIQIANQKGKNPVDLSNEEYCATHLAALSLAAVQEHERTNKGSFINYNQLPDVVWNDLLPNKYRVPVDATMIQRMKEISQNYSKSRDKKDVAFEQDAERKRNDASPAVVEAAATYAGAVYAKLQVLSGQGAR